MRAGLLARLYMHLNASIPNAAATAVLHQVVLFFHVSSV